jgi:glucuronate isomerase
MKTFINDDFLLHSDSAKRLYHDFAKTEPIFDYHCHLNPADIAENRRFADLAEIWLAGDHYKWRTMRSNGIPEKFCTGDAPSREKFLAFARTVPHTLRNPMYHWTHLELLRFFGIDDLLDGGSAEGIWNRANELLAGPGFSARELMERSDVRVVCTTDDPTDDLAHHDTLREQAGPRVYPTFRPDRAMGVDNPSAFVRWVSDLERASGADCTKFSGFLEALEARHTAFHDRGGRLSDHGLRACPGLFASAKKAKKIYDEAMAGTPAGPKDTERFAGYLMVFFGSLDARRGWTKQMHLGAVRNNNTRMHAALGPDSGFDSIGDFPQAAALARTLDAMDRDGALPQTVLYNLNPADNYVFASMAGNFQEGPAAGKIQFGSGWWFLDQKEGMQWQINALSNLGLLSRFVGMLTDSRSFLSYSRHEYFRRILCNMLGREIEDRELPADFDLLGGLVRRVCYGNAESFFGLEV